MCVIVDANVGSDIFGKAPSPAANYFLNRIGEPHTRLVIGGLLLRELAKLSAFKRWYARAARYGRVRPTVSDQDIEIRLVNVPGAPEKRSDDPHILALALASGARLLFTNDRPLQEDFRNPGIINRPRGHIYTTLVNDNVTQVHRNLLARQDLCTWSGCGK